MNKIIQGFVIALFFTFGESNSTPWIGPKQLHPVHGLYVQPSADGSTGDLYVAATEDSGSKTQWLTDQPINFLPVGAATQQHPKTVPLPYTSSFSASGHDESQSTQKRAVMTSPPVQYAYALPVSGGTEGALTYPYAIPAMASTQSASSSSESSSTPCAEGTTAAIPYNPFQFFYPHMMSAYGNAKSILKQSGMSDESAGTIVSQAAPMWSPYSAYPMYVMMDPSAWSQAQAAQTSTTTAPKES